MDQVLVDGRVLPAAEASVSVLDRTLLYGLGAFETFRLWGGVAFRLEKHRARLLRSLAALGLPGPSALDGLPAGLAALSSAARAPEALCRLTVTGGSAPGGSCVTPMRVLAMLRPVPRPWRGRRVVVGVADAVHERSTRLTGVKSTSYLDHYLLRERAEASGHIDDLLLDGAGRVAEATVSSVFMVARGRLVTPPLSAGVLEGVTRGEVLALARAAGLPALEADFTLAELQAAEECFLTGAGKGLVGVDEVAGREFPAARPVTQALTAALARAIADCCGIDAGRVVF